MTDISVPTTDVDTKREPEKLVVPAGSVMWLIMQGLKTEAGDAWMRGFVTAHGEPSWVVNNHWGIKVTQDAEIVQVSPQMTNGTIPSMR